MDLSGTLRWVGERWDRDFGAFPARAVELDSYLLVNAGLEVRLLEGRGGRGAVSFRLSGENLLDSDFQEVFGFKVPGRSVMVGGRVLMGGG
jgi:outer membrane cobalamin receptor